ncbi:MAG: hypothetical protein V1702_04095 [Candidatus Woesearchaeota archaeon]
MKLPSIVRFADDVVRDAYSNIENTELSRQISNAIGAIERDAFSGIQIPKRLMPKEYFKHGIPNLWKCNLANGWRLFYFIVEINSQVYSIILEWLPHKDYERRFGY